MDSLKNDLLTGFINGVKAKLYMDEIASSQGTQWNAISR